MRQASRSDATRDKRLHAVRVLVVDDQAPFRQATRAIIDRSPGFELVGEAPDGESALGLAADVGPDIVIVDIRLPGIDGIETTRRLREQASASVIVLVTSADVRQYSALAESCGATALLPKQSLTPRVLRGLWVAHRQR